MIIENLHNTQIGFDKDFINKGDTVTVTISCKDYNGNYVSGRNYTAYLIAPDGTQTTLGTGIGASAQNYSFTFTANDYGIWTVKCHHAKAQIKTCNNFTSQTLSSTQTIYYNETQVVLKVSGTVSTTSNNWVQYTSIPSSPIDLRPEVPVFAQDFGRKGVWQINDSEGKVYFMRLDGGSGNSDEYMSITWSRRL